MSCHIPIEELRRLQAKDEPAAAEGAARSQAQLHFRERSRQARKAAAELQAKSGVKLIPIKAKRDQRKHA